MASSKSPPEISVILTAHAEGILAGPTARSADIAITNFTEGTGKSVEIIIVLDKASQTTRDVLTGKFGEIATILETEEGDPGQTRNRGIEISSAPYATFLDGDDLWSSNWLVEAWKACSARPDAVFHSHCNVVFGSERNVWWHVDSESDALDPTYLIWSNYWDAMSFARTELYRAYPFKKNDLKLGFGHEDWHWSAWTYSDGIPHKPAPETIHFKRRRPGSQMSLVERSGSVMRPLALNGH